LNVGWDRGNWGAGIQGNYQNGALFDVDFNTETRDILAVKRYWLLNGNVNYNIGDNAIVRLAVTNLADVQPPFPTGGIGTYDILGRRYALSFEYKF
jgi:outer membrane receptor protein involved in Fe transport